MNRGKNNCQPDLVLGRRLAVGGMAEVFLATDGEGTPCVVKRLLPGAGEAARRLFGREREVLACIASPNVVRLLGSGEDHLVLEFVDGPNLAAILAYLAKRGRSLPLPAALAVIAGLCRGLAAVHQSRDSDGRLLGAVHRDVAPSNVLVSRDGAVKLADLGVVHVDLADQPTTAGLKGTLAYMAPEQLLGEPVDRRTDLYAAGLIAYEVLTGIPARPPGAAGLADLLRSRTTLPAPPSSVRPELPVALDVVVLAALAPDPVDRPADVETWLAGLIAACGTPPDRDALGRIAREVTEAETPWERTEVPESALRPRQEAPRPSGRRSAWRWIGGMLGGLGLVAIVLTVLSLVEPSDSSPPPPPPGRGPVTVSSLPFRADAIPSPFPRRDLATVTFRAFPREVRFAFSGEGPIHVSGEGVSGLAPLRTGPMGDGPHVFRLQGRAGAAAVLRLVVSGDKITATLGAPEGRYYEVACGGRNLGTTPAVGIRVDRTLPCRLTGPDGGLSFVIGVVRT